MLTQEQIDKFRGRYMHEELRVIDMDAFSIRVPHEAAAIIRTEAVKRKISITSLMREVIDDYIDDNELSDTYERTSDTINTRKKGRKRESKNTTITDEVLEKWKSRLSEMHKVSLFADTAQES